MLLLAVLVVLVVAIVSVQVFCSEDNNIVNDNDDCVVVLIILLIVQLEFPRFENAHNRFATIIDVALHVVNIEICLRKLFVQNKNKIDRPTAKQSIDMHNTLKLNNRRETGRLREGRPR